MFKKLIALAGITFLSLNTAQAQIGGVTGPSGFIVAVTPDCEPYWNGLYPSINLCPDGSERDPACVAAAKQEWLDALMSPAAGSPYSYTKAACEAERQRNEYLDEADDLADQIADAEADLDAAKANIRSASYYETFEWTNYNAELLYYNSLEAPCAAGNAESCARQALSLERLESISDEIARLEGIIEENEAAKVALEAELQAKRAQREAVLGWATSSAAARNAAEAAAEVALLGILTEFYEDILACDCGN